MKITIPKNRMEIKHLPKDFDLALVTLFTLLCISFVLIPPLNETNGGKDYFGLLIDGNQNGSAICGY